MTVEYICDGCGKREAAMDLPHGVFSPPSWFGRYDKELKRNLDACSRACIEKAAEKHGGHKIIIPL